MGTHRPTHRPTHPQHLHFLGSFRSQKWVSKKAIVCHHIFEFLMLFHLSNTWQFLQGRKTGAGRSTLFSFLMGNNMGWIWQHNKDKYWDENTFPPLPNQKHLSVSPIDLNGWREQVLLPGGADLQLTFILLIAGIREDLLGQRCFG